MAGLAPIVFVVLFVISAPYGRHSRTGWGPTISNRTGWLLMEAPASLVMVAMFFIVPPHAVIFALLLIWQLHYFHRAFIYPFTLPSRTMPWLVVVLAIFFNTANATLNGWHFVKYADWYNREWLTSLHFVAGVLCFAAGFYITKRSDAILRQLRPRGETTGAGYKIPEGFLYRWVSCPNYLGECIQWLGWALMTLSPAAWVFLLWTMANLIPRAISHQRWYRQTFVAYPRERRALIPYLL